MTKEEKIRAEQVREIVREALNKMLDQEYEAIIQEIEDGKSKLSNRSLTDIIDEILSPKRGELGGHTRG